LKAVAKNVADSMVFRAGTALVVSDEPTFRGQLGVALLHAGYSATYAPTSADDYARADGVIVDGRAGAHVAAAVLRRMGPRFSRAAVVVADAREPNVVPTIRECRSNAVVVYSPFDIVQIVDVLDNLLSRARAS
jgi:DNA-binding response OmpR family regulator